MSNKGNNFWSFFHPKRLGFHILLAVVLTILIVWGGFHWLGSYTRHGDEVKMPNYVGKKASELINSQTEGFTFEICGAPQFDKTQPEGTVLKQSPEPDLNVKKGRKVLLTISTAVPQMISMPALAGNITLRQAKNILADSGLEVGTIVEVESDSPDLVLGQYRQSTGKPIAAGTKIRQGEKIKLEVGVARRMPVDDGTSGDASDDTEANPQTPDQIDF